MRRIPENFRFAYDAFGRRVWRNLPQGEGVHHFVFLPDGRLAGEYKGSSGAVVGEYIWMDDRLVGSVDALKCEMHSERTDRRPPGYVMT